MKIYTLLLSLCHEIKKFPLFRHNFFSSLRRCTRIGVSSTTRSFSLLSVSSFYRVSFCEIHTERLCKAMIIEEFLNVECFWRFKRIFWKLFVFTPVYPLVIPILAPVYPCLPLFTPVYPSFLSLNFHRLQNIS